MSVTTSKQRAALTAEKFRDWQDRMKLSDLAVSKALGISRNSVASYRKNGAPKAIAMACTAYAMGLPLWGSVEIEVILKKMQQDGPTSPSDQ